MGHDLVEFPATAAETTRSMAKDKLRVVDEMGGVIVHHDLVSKEDQ